MSLKGRLVRLEQQQQRQATGPTDGPPPGWWDWLLGVPVTPEVYAACEAFWDAVQKPEPDVDRIEERLALEEARAGN